MEALQGLSQRETSLECTGRGSGSSDCSSTCVQEMEGFHGDRAVAAKWRWFVPDYCCVLFFAFLCCIFRSSTSLVFLFVFLTSCCALKSECLLFFVIAASMPLSVNGRASLFGTDSPRKRCETVVTTSLSSACLPLLFSSSALVHACCLLRSIVVNCTRSARISHFDRSIFIPSLFCLFLCVVPFLLFSSLVDLTSYSPFICAIRSRRGSKVCGMVHGKEERWMERRERRTRLRGLVQEESFPLLSCFSLSCHASFIPLSPSPCFRRSSQFVTLSSFSFLFLGLSCCFPCLLAVSLTIVTYLFAVLCAAWTTTPNQVQGLSQQIG